MRLRTFAVCFCLFTSAATAAEKLAVRVLSSRPDVVSGGDALIEITGSAAGAVQAKLNGKAIDTSGFRSNQNATLGIVSGLADGRNTLEVQSAGKRARVELINHPIKGPIFSGPQQKPFVCETEAAGLGPALDADCSAKTKVEYFYKSTEPPQKGSQPFKPYDSSASRPADLAKTTTSDGNTVDYIVRRETGTINRAIYEISILHTPGQPAPDPWTRTPGWNRRLVYSFGGGCAAGYRQARPVGSLSDVFLSKGYASASSSLNVFGNNCDDVLSAETLSMVREHFIEQFGPPEFTIGWGGSGGSMQQELIAQNYPGLLDGILPAASYPDITTIIPTVVDCSLLARAFDASGLNWTDEQKTAVSGYPTWNTCVTWMRYFSPQLVNAKNCAQTVPKSEVYDPSSKRDGARCSIYDTEANLLGRDSSTGFARRPLDNVGVQYGLAAFNAGKITADQFVALNEKVGGYDADGNMVASRTVADPLALRAAYQKGRVLHGAALATTPMFDLRQYLDSAGDIHDSYRSLVTRARLKAANGNADNQVIWTLPPKKQVAGAGSGDWLALMDRWLSAIRKDMSKDGAAAKIARNKPTELVDACFTEDGQKIAEPRTHQGTGRCDQLYPAYTDPRIVAGAPLTDDIMKCALKPLEAGGYRQPLSADQLSRLKAVFPQGVCDYSKPGIEQQKLQGTWLRY